MVRIFFILQIKKVWEYINQFAEFNNYINSPIADIKTNYTIFRLI